MIPYLNNSLTYSAKKGNSQTQRMRLAIASLSCCLKKPLSRALYCAMAAPKYICAWSLVRLKSSVRYSIRSFGRRLA